MAKTFDEVYALRLDLEEEYQERHEAHMRLRKFWHGRYWENTEADKGGIASIFRDLTARQSDVGPDIKLVYNVLKDVCVKFQTYLAPTPMIRCYVDPPSTPTRRNQAETRERFLYGMWAMNDVNVKMADQGWFLPLMGDCYQGIFPDLDKNMCRMILRSPEYAYPLMSYDTFSEDGVIFRWKAKTSAVRRAFPEWSPTDNKGRSVFSIRTSRRTSRQSADPMVEILEYSDKDCFYRWIDGTRVAGVEHDLNFDLFEHVKFINVPGEVWGHGAVEQAVNLVEMGNAYLSLMMQSAIENVFPVMVIENPMMAPETIERGAGAVIPVNATGKVMYLQPPAGNLLAQGDFMRNVERMIQQDSSMPEVNFGEAHQSIVTGKAINQLQGAGTGTLVEMVQGVGIGKALSSWNEKAITIARNMFADDTMHLYGTETGSIADLSPRHFSMNIKGKQLVGSTRNEVVFMPYLDMQQKVVIGLQLAGAGLVSKQWQRENVGIPDNEAMEEEMVSEAIQDAVLGMIVQTITAPEDATAAEGQADDYIEGGHNAHPLTRLVPPALPPGTPGAPAPGPGAPQGPPSGGGGGTGLPIGQIPGGPGQVESPPVKLPPGAPVPAGSPAELAQQTPASHGQQHQPLVLDQVISAFKQIQVQGHVYLVGEIVQTGQTADTVTVDIDNPADRDTVGHGVPFPVQVKVISGTPNEPYIDVSPDATTTAIQGEEPHPDEALG